MMYYRMLAVLMLVIFAITADATEEVNGTKETFRATVLHPLATPDVLVIKTSDGEERTVRLFGLASPLAEQPFAAQLVDYVTKNMKEITFTVDVLTTDNSDLPVVWLHPEEGLSLNETLLQQGLAWWDEINAPDATELKKYAAQALVAGEGLWQDPAPLAPWDYRASHQLEEVTYEVTPPPTVEETPLPPPSETPTLTAKGTMTEAPQKASPPPLPALPQDYMAIAMKHQPRIERNAQGLPLGFTANNINNIPGASQLGFQNGDIVRSVNGIALTSEAQIFGLVGQLQGAKQVTLEVIRDGKPVTITIPL